MAREPFEPIEPFSILNFQFLILLLFGSCLLGIFVQLVGKVHAKFVRGLKKGGFLLCLGGDEMLVDVNNQYEVEYHAQHAKTFQGSQDCAKYFVQTIELDNLDKSFDAFPQEERKHDDACESDGKSCQHGAVALDMDELCHPMGEMHCGVATKDDAEDGGGFKNDASFPTFVKIKNCRNED